LQLKVAGAFVTMSHTRLIVTGGAGFIGSHLVDRLLAQGRIVLCIDDFNDAYDPGEKRRNVARHLCNERYALVEANICDADRMCEIVGAFQPTAIVHLAARAGVRASLADPSLYEAVNVSGTLNLLEAARRNGVSKLVNASSSSVYGLNQKVPFAETDRIETPASPYAATKIAGEAFCRVYSHLYGLSVVSLRLFTVYGPRQRPDLAIRRFSQRLLAGEGIQLFGDGSSRRDYTYVDDIVAGIIASVDLAGVSYEVINLGNSRPIRLADVVRQIERELGCQACIEWLPDQPGDVPVTYADISRARSLLGYSPTTSFAEGVRNLVSWLRDQAE